MGKRVKHWDTMEKLYGNDGTVKPVEVLCSTGSHALDELMGIWGLPRGRVVQYAGKESSGKTLMSLLAIKEWQSLDPDNWAIFIDAEETFDVNWAETLGVDMDRLYMIKSNDGIEIWTQLCGVPSKEIGKPKVRPGILDLEKEEPSGLGLIVLDSIAVVNTPIEMSRQVGNTNIAPMGRFMPDALRRLVPLLSQTGVTFIAINQVRMDMSIMFGDPETTPGGKAWKHSCSIMVNFTRSMSKKTHIIDEVSAKRIGHIGGARMDKNKVALPDGKCSIELNYFEGIVNKHKEVGELAIMYGVVERPNNRTYVFGDKKWTSRDDFFVGLEDEKLADVLLAEVRSAKEKGVKPSRDDGSNEFFTNANEKEE